MKIVSSKSILSYFKEKTVDTVSDGVNVVDSTVSNDVNIEQTVDLISEASRSGITSSFCRQSKRPIFQNFLSLLTQQWWVLLRHL